MIYGYARVSTAEQNLERQAMNIKSREPKAVIVTDEFTGKTMNRPNWSKLYAKLQKNDKVIFDEVSRMSRSAEEGFKVYEELYSKGVDLVFLKEPHINTEAYRQALEGSLKVDVESGDENTDELVSSIISALNTFMMNKVKEDIKRAFEQSQAETELRSQRAKEGIAVAKINGKQIGRAKGDILQVKKQEPIKALIKKLSRDFEGHMTDKELLSCLKDKTIKIPQPKRSGKVEEKEISAQISRNTLYKYKKQIREGV